MENEIKNDRDFEICPFCNTDMTDGQLTYVERGCTNYIHYKKDARMGWIADDELDGEDALETFYACKSCGQELPTEYQEYFSNNV